MRNIAHSKLQTEVALSTCEAEYIALSQCTRVLIPLRRLIKNISDVFDPNDGAVNLLNGTSKCFNSLGKSIILEDNAACIAVANDDDSKVRPRTRHLSIKWHHFRDQIKEGWLTVEKVASANNWSDIFTKPLSQVTFDRLRDEMMGWKSTPQNKFPFEKNPIYVACYSSTFSKISLLAIDGVPLPLVTVDTS